MKFQYKNLVLNLNENLEELKLEIEELNKLHNIIKNSSDAYILEGKTQLVGKNKTFGIRNRKQHTDGTVAIARRAIRLTYETAIDDDIKEQDIYKLNLEKELLYAQIISEAHDLGHTPFGHVGERVLNKCLQESHLTKEELTKTLARRKEIYGEKYELNQGHNEEFDGTISFEHSEQSAKLIYDLIKHANIDSQIIDVNRIVQGILSHSISRVRQEDIPNDLVIQIVRQADKNEYINNDFDEIREFINMDVINNKQLLKFINLPKHERIKIIIQKLVEGALEKGYVDDNIEAMQKIKELKEIYQKVLFSMDVDGKRGLLTGENIERISLMLSKIYMYYKKHPEKIAFKSLYQTNPIGDGKESKKVVINRDDFETSNSIEEQVINYMSRMDNERVENEYRRLIKERIMQGKGYGIEPISQEELQTLQNDYYKQRINMEKVRQELDGTEHSEKECEESLKLSIRKLIENALTQKGRERMLEVRKLHKEENQRDEELRKLMIVCDQNPEERKKLEEKKEEAFSNRMNKLKEDWKER